MFENHRYYETLEVAPGAPLEVIKAAYRALAHLYHPDKNNNSSESVQLMRELNQAYDVLSDPVSRKFYDDWLSSQSKVVKSDSSGYNAKESDKVAPKDRRKRGVRRPNSELPKKPTTNRSPQPKPHGDIPSDEPPELTNSDLFYGTLSLLVFFVGLWLIFSSSNFKNNAVQTTGRITSFLRTGGSSGRFGTTVSYEFKVNDVPYNGNGTVARQIFFRDEKVEVFYDRENPSDSQLALPSTTIGWGWVVVGVCGFFVFFEPRKRWRKGVSAAAS